MPLVREVGRRLSLPVVAAVLLVGCGLGLVGQTQLERGAEARRLADEALVGYIQGENGFQELRDFYERRRGSDLLGVCLLDSTGAVKNRYPRDFEPSGWRVTAPIRGADGVVRDVVEVSHRPWPPLSSNLALWVCVFLLGLTGYQAWRAREERLEAEAREALAEAARRESETRLALLERERELERLEDVWQTFYAQMSEDSSQLTNQLQALNGFITQIDISLADAVHDLYKAPLLGTGDLADKSHLSLADVKSFLRCLEDRSIEVTREEMTIFVRNVDQTIDAIKWVIDGLPEYANRTTQPVDPRAELEALINHLPPNLRNPDDGLRIEADTTTARPSVLFNPVHFRSVVKNALYNAAASIRRRKRQEEDLAGRVTIGFVEEPGRLGVVVEDNGTGLSEAALAKLYRGRVEAEHRRRRSGKGSIIVSSYLAFHHATVEVSNLPAGGARATFWFQKVGLAAGQPVASGQAPSIEGGTPV